MSVAAIVLAAGRASRYRAAGGQAVSKLVAGFRGEPLVRHAVRAAVASRATPVVVVTGHARAAVETALEGFAVRFVHNPDFASGLASSLRTGLAAIGDAATAVVVLLGDMPLVTADLVDALIASSDAAPAAGAALPVVEGVRGNPVLLARCLFGPAARLRGDEGARRLLREPGLTVLEIEVRGDAARLDIDEPSGLQG